MGTETAVELGALVRGRRVWQTGAGCHQGIILSYTPGQGNVYILGRGMKPAPGGHCRIVFAECEYPRVDEAFPVSILTGGPPWEVCVEKRLATEEQMQAALDAVTRAAGERELAEHRETERQAAETERIIRENPGLERTDGKASTGRVVGAKNIRKELKAAFPGVSFRVTSERSTINVSWTDGPTSEQVQAVTDKYRQGDFDGMTDSYTRDQDSTWPDTFGGADYVFAQRGDSLAGLRRAWAAAGGDVADIVTAKAPDGSEYWDRWSSKNHDAIFRAWRTADLR